MSYAFATLFVRHPELRQIFPVALDAHRVEVFAALSRYVWGCEQPASLAGWLARLARAHRKYGVTEEHYLPFCDALATALRAHSGAAWSAEVEDAWHDAFLHMATSMAAVAATCKDEPPWWLAEVTSHELRRPDLAVITLRPDQPYAHRPGQYVSLQVPRWPRTWRRYSIANAAGPDGLLTLHVRAVPGGTVSSALVHQTQPGDTLILGPAKGRMTADAISSGTVVGLAGGTGLAPVKAIIEALGARPQPPQRMSLFVGARTEADLYDIEDLRRLESSCPALTVTPVISEDPWYDGRRGGLAEAAASQLGQGRADVLVSGPSAMVVATVALCAARAPLAHLHFDAPLAAGTRWHAGTG